MIILPAIKESSRDYDAIEKAIKILFKREIYLPALQGLQDFRGVRLLENSAVQNSPMPDLRAALQSGRITYSRGVFSGRLNSEISKQLRALGATFDHSSGTYKLLSKKLPRDIQFIISASDFRFQDRINKIDERLGNVISDELLGRGISSKLKTDHLFDRTLWRVDQEFKKSVGNITVAPQLTEHARKRIAAEWSENMQLWIKDFTQKEIVELRANIQKAAFAGDRYGSAVKAIQASYGVTANKAKFLARQETSLLMTKFKQTRYQAAGIEVYKWVCVTGTKLHPVRPLHAKNNGKYFRWDAPPVVDENGAKKNPGQDYNCRCYARPCVGYKGKLG